MDLNNNTFTGEKNINWKNGLGLLIIIAGLYYGTQIFLKLFLWPLKFVFDIKSKPLSFIK